MKQEHKNRTMKIACALIICTLATCALVYALRGETVTIDGYNQIDRPAAISPDYCGTTLPVNIAPLNFLIKESGSHYCVKISSRQGPTIEVFSRSPKIMIPKKRWRKILEANRGEQLQFDIFARSREGQWNRFSPIVNTIAAEDVDGYVVYRKIHPAHSAWAKMGIYQRDLEQFDESLVLDNGYFEGGCLNCHSFCANHPDKMLIGLRSSKYGSSALLVDNGRAQKIGTKFGYTSWHPSGQLAAYSINKVRQFFHSSAGEVRDVIDLDSLLAYYLLESGTIKTAPEIAKKDRLETYPTWSPDGRYLYFCSAPLTWEDRNAIPAEYDQIKYDLMRISYDIDNDQWGKAETILSAQDTGMSILLPRISPDGHWLLFCMCDYGCFPVHRRSSDLYMIDLEAAQQTGRYEPRRLEINSEDSESWHSWSSNGRWIAFSSKRQSGVFTRSYLSYVNKEGRVYKPVLLPQKDPAHYDKCLWTYSVPELISEPIQVTKEELGRVVRGSQMIPADMPVTMATPRAGAKQQGDPWLTERE
ncbi:MAG: cytochrome C biosynthesis protein [Planctomycetota bacterium]|nr:cytochrome C biosynthesis protein [Planctomycetota bacterium]